METIDLAPAAAATATVVRALTDDDLARPTPCPAYTVADLVDHVGGLCVAFTAAARKQPLHDGDGAGPSGDGARLEPGFRDRISRALDELAAAWTDPAAYDGMTQAGPVELPGSVAAQVALNEVVVHGWDLAVATGQPYAPDPSAVETCRGFVESFEPPEGGAADAPPEEGGAFGSPVAVADDATPLDRLVGAAGRDPRWSALS